MPEKNGKLDLGLIRELAAILREADLGEIEIEQGDLRIKVVKPETKTVHVAAAPAFAQAHVPAPAAPAAGPAASASAGDHPGAVKSPMVGTVYLAPEEGAAQFVKVGDTVAVGQTLLLIEAMKTFNQIRAPKAGTVTRILIETGMPVEYGEPLLIIE
jgi:acetyl-CoA carboxylase biotin carboxyl carrier protein